MQKRFISNLFDFVIPLIILVGYVSIVLVSDKLPAKKTSFVVFSIVIFSMICGALISGEAGIRGYGIVKKNERPSLYWAQVGVLFLIAVSFSTLALLSE